ncbi:hypothetical protein H6P81_015667 [Aristolochia fimbriata]|uniref:Ubiquitin-like protease family profile domain-containing protein n=1 Tax=Aristolochia fimbriata TaxID=158543 RepID=A0AAV7E9X9_ARIFI|nr:hypothetical protein H6P81_015667 [Aristolochia fimbriata]
MRCIGISLAVKVEREEDRVVQFNAHGKASALKEEMVSRGFLDATEFELVTVEDHPQQKTGYDCGIFMVKYMDFLSRDGCDLNFTQDDIPRFRGEIAANIIRGHLVDVPSSNSAFQLLLQAHGVPHDHGYELSEVEADSW